MTEREDTITDLDEKKSYEPPMVVYDASIDDLAKEIGPAQACTGFTPIIPNVPFGN